MIAGIWQSSWHVILIVGIVSTRSVVWCDHFTNHYAVQVEGGVDEARRIAVQHGFVFVNEVNFCFHLNFPANIIGFMLWMTFTDSSFIISCVFVMNILMSFLKHFISFNEV